MEKTISFQVLGMTCGGCARAVRQAIESVPGATSCEIVPGGRCEVSLDEGRTDIRTVAAAIERAGFRPVLEHDE